MPNDPKSRIRSAMGEQGHTYRSIGEMIGITPQAVSEIVNGRTEGATARYALATALGVEVEDLWPEDGGSGMPDPAPDDGDRTAPGPGRAEGDGDGNADGNGDGVRGEGSSPGPAACADDAHPAEREASPAARTVSVSIYCPKERRPSSVELGVAGGEEAPAWLSVVRCEHFRDRAVACDMECLAEGE